MAARVAAAATILREFRVDATPAYDPARHEAFHTPALMLAGERSPHGQRAVVDPIDSMLLNSRIVVLPGQEPWPSSPHRTSWPAS